MSSAPFIFRLLNPVMKTMLKSPLHSLVSDKIMVISFKGRKTGTLYSTPVSYCQEDNLVYCSTHANWWKNLVDGAKVQLLIRRKEITGTATPIREDREKKLVGLRKLLAAVPNDAAFYDVKVDQQGNFSQSDLERAVDKAIIIEVRLEDAL